MPPQRSRQNKVMDQDEYAQFEDRLGRIIDERLGYVVEKITRHMASIIDGRKSGRGQNRSVSYSTGVAMESTGHNPLSRQRSHMRLEECGVDTEYSHPPIYDKDVFEEDGVGKEYSCPPLYDEDPCEEENGAGIEYSTPPIYDDDFIREGALEEEEENNSIEQPVYDEDPFYEEVVDGEKLWNGGTSSTVQHAKEDYVSTYILQPTMMSFGVAAMESSSDGLNIFQSSHGRHAWKKRSWEPLLQETDFKAKEVIQLEPRLQETNWWISFFHGPQEHFEKKKNSGFVASC